jgi:hypothetical protein
MARKFLTNLDLAQNQLLNSALQNLGAAPASPVAGQGYFDTTLHQPGWYSGSAWLYAGGQPGTVTGTSVVAANGFAGSVATPSSTPAITISTTVTGLLKGNGTAVSAATAGSDYLAPAGSGAALTGLTQSQVSGLVAALALLAPLAGPAFTGAPTVPTPTTSTGIANKGYVDSAVQGISAKYTAAAATTGAETYTVAAGSVTAISGTAVDGVSPNVGDYVLVMNAPAASGTGIAGTAGTGSLQPGNGLYLVTSNTTNLSLSRAADMSGANAPFGTYVFVAAGTANGSNGYAVGTPGTSAAFTYGTGSIQFTQFSGAGDPVAGTGLTKAGNTISLTTPVAAANGGAGTVSGILKANGSGVVSSAKYAAAIGDGSSTSITVTHNLGTQDVIVQVYDAATYVQYEVDVTRTSTTVVTLGFATAPALNSVRAVVVG